MIKLAQRCGPKLADILSILMILQDKMLESSIGQRPKQREIFDGRSPVQGGTESHPSYSAFWAQHGGLTHTVDATRPQKQETPREFQQEP